MSEKLLKVGARVEVTKKDLQGTIAYVGTTSFASGKWIGVVLDEPKGKNNGTVQGSFYFECPENYGIFMRPTQLRLLKPAPDSALTRLSEDFNETASGASAATQPTRARLSGSRTFLSSKRQSLLGLRPSLSATITERSPGSTNLIAKKRKSVLASALGKDLKTGSNTGSGDNNGGSSHATSKRASFVETGLLKLLKPSQPMRSSSFTVVPAAASISAEDKASNAEQLKLIEELRTQVNDLTEKLETVKQRRNEDKERLREFDKMKIQFDQMQEFRTKIMMSQTSLQKELQRARQEAKDAIEARERHAQSMADLADNFEMITLDKEMAEEKADALQLELDTAKERIEELQIDLELLCSEMQNKVDNGEAISSGISSYEFKQLEQQNARLKETLVRLRDLSAHDKHGIQKLNKELEMKKSEFTEMERTKEELSAKIDNLKAIVIDLQDQVDAAFGAEEMVEQLAEKKMELEDRVKLLEEEIQQLEQLEEIHEQLVESNHELELDLREELDMAHAAKRDVLRELDAAIETIYDRDQTISKFRGLVQKLNEQLLEMRDHSISQEHNRSLLEASGQFTATETIDYKQLLAESKAYTRAIDEQLLQFELTQANEHVQMLTAFMPESFMTRGGDHDSIQVVLLISRMIFKCGIIIGQAREHFPAVDQVTRETIIQGHTVQQYAFKCSLMHYIHNLECVLHQLLHGLNSCQPDTLLCAGSHLPEMVAQEKTIDSIIELLKSNQLDENSNTDSIQKCATFFNAMNSVLLGGEDLVNETQMTRDYVASLAAACDAIQNDVAVVRALVNDKEGNSEVTMLMQYLAVHVEAIKQQVELIKRRLPRELHVIKCGISASMLKNMRLISHALSSIMSVLHMATKQAVHVIVAHIESDNTAEHSIDQIKFHELLSTAYVCVYEQDDCGLSNNFGGVLGQAKIDLKTMAQHLLDKECEIMMAANQQNQERHISPIALRAQLIKKQLEQKNVLAATLENRELDKKQLKLALKSKQDELSEMQIRKDLAEKKLSVLQHEYERTVDKWKQQYEEAAEQLKLKEQEYERTLDHLQSDIEALESEKEKLRDKLKASGVSIGKASHTSKRSLGVPTDSMSNFDSSTHAVQVHSSPHRSVAGGGALVDGVPAEELQLLKLVCNNERNARLHLQAQQLRKQLRNLEPIYVPQPKDKRIAELETELTKMKHAWALSLLQAGAPKEISSKKFDNILEAVTMQRRQQPLPNKAEISSKAGSLAAEILSEYLQRHAHRAAQTDFAPFPTVEATRILKD